MNITNRKYVRISITPRELKYVGKGLVGYNSLNMYDTTEEIPSNMMKTARGRRRGTFLKYGEKQIMPDSMHISEVMTVSTIESPFYLMIQLYRLCGFMSIDMKPYTIIKAEIG